MCKLKLSYLSSVLVSLFDNILSGFKWFKFLLISVVFYTSLTKTQSIFKQFRVFWAFGMILKRKLYECLDCEVLGRVGYDLASL